MNERESNLEAPLVSNACNQALTGGLLVYLKLRGGLFYIFAVVTFIDTNTHVSTSPPSHLDLGEHYSGARYASAPAEHHCQANLVTYRSEKFWF